MKRIIASIAMAASVSACGFQPEKLDPRKDVYVMTNENSKAGDAKAFYMVLEDIWETGTPVRIDADVVSSAATFFLAADEVCMNNPDTVFRFHGPQHTATAVLSTIVTFAPLPVSFMAKDRADYVRGLMAELYNGAYPGLGDWFLANAAKKAGFVYANLTAAEMHQRFGVPFCEGVV